MTEDLSEPNPKKRKSSDEEDKDERRAVKKIKFIDFSAPFGLNTDKEDNDVSECLNIIDEAKIYLDFITKKTGNIGSLFDRLIFGLKIEKDSQNCF